MYWRQWKYYYGVMMTQAKNKIACIIGGWNWQICTGKELL